MNTVFDRYAGLAGVIFRSNALLYTALRGLFRRIDIIRGAAQMLGIEMTRTSEDTFPAPPRNLAQVAYLAGRLDEGLFVLPHFPHEGGTPPAEGRCRKGRAVIAGRSCARRGHLLCLLCNRYMARGGAQLAGLRHMERVLISSSMLLEAPSGVFTNPRVYPRQPYGRFFQICRTFILVTIGRYFSDRISGCCCGYAEAQLHRSFAPPASDGPLLNLGLGLYNMVVALAGCVVMLIVSILQSGAAISARA